MQIRTIQAKYILDIIYFGRKNYNSYYKKCQQWKCLMIYSIIF